MSARGVVLAALAALVVAAAPRPAAAQPRAPLPTIEPLVSTEWLQREIGRPDLVILQLGGAESFAKGHLPGAVALDYEREVVAAPVAGGLRVELPSPEALQATLRAKGVTATSRVVIVFDQPQVFTRAGRTFFTLEWGGLGGRVAILDGGLPKWQREGRYVATGAGKRVRPSAALALAPAAHLRATRDDVSAMIGQAGMRIVDARDTVFYNGRPWDQNPRGGHIPSAVSLPFSTVTNADGTLKPRAELEQVVAAAGVRADETVATYCHLGVQASWMYFTMRVLGRDVRMYDGSFDEWSRDPALPVTGPSTRP